MAHSAVRFFSFMLVCVTAVDCIAQLRTVALSGQQAPGAPSGAVFDSFVFLPHIDNSGGTAFVATLRGTGVSTSNEEGVWSEGSGALSLIAREGDLAPGTPNDARFRTFGSRLKFNDAGEVAFLGAVGFISTGLRGIWTEKSGALSLVARTGQQAPGLPSGALFSDISFLPSFNNAGQVSFRANATGAVGIWSGGSGSLSLAVRSDQQAPGLPSGTQFYYFDSSSSLPLNDLGQNVFRATLRQAGGVTGANDQGIWFGSSGALSLVAREGDQAPGAPSGAVFGSLFSGYEAVLNNAGEIAFLGRLLQGAGGVDSQNDAGIWHGLPGAISLAAREGDQAPGTPTGARFGELTGPMINKEGRLVFEAALQQGIGGVDSTNDTGIWTLGEGILKLIAREGEQAPGAPLGVTFSGSEFWFPSINAVGEIAFTATISTGNRGVWVQDAGGQLQKIIARGEFLEVAPGDIRRISNFDFDGLTGNEDGLSTAFNDLGQITFKAIFSDGSQGIFVADGPVSFDIPEPFAAQLAVGMFVALALPRRRGTAKCAH